MNKRMPIIFSGHGSPMIALEKNEITKEMNNVGNKIIEEYGKPKAILSISAHWFTHGTFIQNNENPKQVYDMYGFPDELYQVQYPVKGNKELTNKVLELLKEDVKINNEWGIDHGTWTVLIHMFPKADIPIVQLSVNSDITPKDSYEIGKRLKSLRDEGYLIFASGNIVHNLMFVEWDNKGGSKEAVNSNEEVIELIKNKNYEKLIKYEEIENHEYAIPTPEHYLPLLYILGATTDSDKLEIFNNICNLGSLAMTGFIFK